MSAADAIAKARAIAAKLGMGSMNTAPAPASDLGKRKTRDDDGGGGGGGGGGSYYQPQTSGVGCEYRFLLLSCSVCVYSVCTCMSV